MGILDEAIREHLELKRQHGADDSELQQLEDEAFGPPQRPGDEESKPDPLAEAPTEFMAQPDLPDEASSETASEAPEETTPREEAAARIANLQEAPQASDSPATEPVEEPPVEESLAEEPAADEPVEDPAEEEQPAAEHEAITEPPESAEEPAPEPQASAPSTEERHAIAEQPTEMYDIEEELGELEAQAPEDDGAEEDDDDFWDEQRLSDELDQALEAPFEEEAEPDEPVAPAAEEEEDEVRASSSREEDVLEETPDFLEESPEDDELWFEQKPPKDFDFDD